MKDYYCFEIDSRGRVFDYRAAVLSPVRSQVELRGLGDGRVPTDKGYVVEGRIPLATLVDMGFPRLGPGREGFSAGSIGPSSATTAAASRSSRQETIHNRGRKLDGPPPLEEWISWVDPKTPEPDFHVPSSLGWLEIVE